ncbi:MAG: RibD family protein, partial [Myxococcota bacterium]|nr:RibD family protein [Myxococcota bacterium]
KWITGPEARAAVHQLRSETDAVMVGSGTAIADDPLLTVRDAPLLGSPPARVIVDSRLRVPVTSGLFRDAPQIPLILATSITDQDRIRSREATGAEVIVIPEHREHVHLKEMMKALGSREAGPVTSLLVEGGSGLAQVLVSEGLVDRLHLFMAPMLIGADGLPSIGPLGCDNLSDATSLDIERIGRVGADIEVVATLRSLPTEER